MKSIRALQFFNTLFLTSLFILFCSKPQNPSAPQNTKITPLVKNMYNIIEEKVGSDSLGNTISVGAVLNLPENVDSVFLEISADGETIFETMIVDIDRSESTDTIWIKYLFLKSPSSLLANPCMIGCGWRLPGGAPGDVDFVRPV